MAPRSLRVVYVSGGEASGCSSLSMGRGSQCCNGLPGAVCADVRTPSHPPPDTGQCSHSWWRAGWPSRECAHSPPGRPQRCPPRPPRPRPPLQRHQTCQPLAPGPPCGLRPSHCCPRHCPWALQGPCPHSTAQGRWGGGQGGGGARGQRRGQGEGRRQGHHGHWVVGEPHPPWDLGQRRALGEEAPARARPWWGRGSWQGPTAPRCPHPPLPLHH